MAGQIAIIMNYCNSKIGSLNSQNSVLFGTGCTVVLFNLVKNRTALFKTKKNFNVSDLAMSIISKIKSKTTKNV